MREAGGHRAGLPYGNASQKFHATERPNTF